MVNIQFWEKWQELNSFDTFLVDLYQTIYSGYSFVFLLQNPDEIWDRFRQKMQKKLLEMGNNGYGDGNIVVELENNLNLWILKLFIDLQLVFFIVVLIPKKNLEAGTSSSFDEDKYGKWYSEIVAFYIYPKRDFNFRPYIKEKDIKLKIKILSSDEFWMLVIKIFGNVFLHISHKNIFQKVWRTYAFERSDKCRILVDICLVNLCQHATTEYRVVFLLQVREGIWDRLWLNIQKFKFQLVLTDMMMEFVPTKEIVIIEIFNPNWTGKDFRKFQPKMKVKVLRKISCWEVNLWNWNFS